MAIYRSMVFINYIQKPKKISKYKHGLCQLLVISGFFAFGTGIANETEVCDRDKVVKELLSAGQRPF